MPEKYGTHTDGRTREGLLRFYWLILYHANSTDLTKQCSYYDISLRYFGLSVAADYWVIDGEWISVRAPRVGLYWVVTGVTRNERWLPWVIHCNHYCWSVSQSLDPLVSGHPGWPHARVPNKSTLTAAATAAGHRVCFLRLSFNLQDVGRPQSSSVGRALYWKGWPVLRWVRLAHDRPNRADWFKQCG